MDYEVITETQEIYSSEKVTSETIIRYEYKHAKTGWWISREEYDARTSFPDRSEMWLPDEIVDHITAFNAKEKLIK